ncbi:uncharacterized protein LOC124459553 isoform X2 [Xenia sp. Carnegie-2017]|uniref:uncharacterized protein LOC124459553 isoform X2 n=1 Tax=Xenia sp. Carnegie-2017 TaxID=2897299 RepID=UPI001F0384FB|nr:uncharacterized protein LOC124459553 isoform X2 [Xenia sp. Carnegie-2017]
MSVSKLQEQFLNESSMFSTKQQVLERLLQSYVVVKKHFGTKENKPQMDDEHDELTKNFEKQHRLCKDVEKYLQALREESEVLVKVQRERDDVTSRNKELMRRLQDVHLKKELSKSQKETKTESRLRRQIKEQQEKNEVARNIYESLIYGSGVDWASDEEMRDMVLSLGQPKDFLDQAMK